MNQAWSCPRLKHGTTSFHAIPTARFSPTARGCEILSWVMVCLLVPTYLEAKHTWISGHENRGRQRKTDENERKPKAIWTSSGHQVRQPWNPWTERGQTDSEYKTKTTCLRSETPVWRVGPNPRPPWQRSWTSFEKNKSAQLWCFSDAFLMLFWCFSDAFLMLFWCFSVFCSHSQCFVAFVFRILLSPCQSLLKSFHGVSEDVWRCLKSLVELWSRVLSCARCRRRSPIFLGHWSGCSRTPPQHPSSLSWCK